jgi:hypothetical protein
MPSPVGHALAGVAIHALSARNAQEMRSLPRAAGVALLALGPDMDFAVEWLGIGYRHQGELHSAGMAVAVGVACAIAAALSGVTSARRGAWIAAAAWLSHVALDIFSIDTSPPFGPMALWPLSRRHAHSPVPVFLDVGRAPDWRTARHDALAVSWELFILLPMCALIWRWRAKKTDRPRSTSTARDSRRSP